MKKLIKFSLFTITMFSFLFAQIGVKLYRDSKFTGGFSNFEVGSHSNLSQDNDKVSSIKVEKGYQVIIYSDGNFKGRSQIITFDQENLDTFDFNDKISSIKVQTHDIKNDPIVYVYYDGNYKGRYNFFGLGDFGSIWPNDRISSIKVKFGYQFTAFEHGNFEGKSITFTNDLSDLADFNWGDNISSLKIVMDPRYKALNEALTAKQTAETNAAEALAAKQTAETNAAEALAAKQTAETNAAKAVADGRVAVAEAEKKIAKAVADGRVAVAEAEKKIAKAVAERKAAEAAVVDAEKKIDKAISDKRKAEANCNSN